MGLFRCKDCESLKRDNANLRAQLSDKEEILLKKEVHFQEERKDLIEKIMALARPEALREFRRDPSQRPERNGQVGRSTGPGNNLEAESRPAVSGIPTIFKPSES